MSTRTLILDKQQIEQRINRLAYQVYEDNADEQEIIIAGIMKSGYIVAERIADVLARVVDVGARIEHVDAVDDDLTLLVLFQAIDAADHRRLAGPGRSADDDALAAMDGEIDVLEDMEVPVPLVDAGHLDDDVGR